MPNVITDHKPLPYYLIGTHTINWHENTTYWHFSYCTYLENKSPLDTVRKLLVAKNGTRHTSDSQWKQNKTRNELVIMSRFPFRCTTRIWKVIYRNYGISGVAEVFYFLFFAKLKFKKYNIQLAYPVFSIQSEKPLRWNTSVCCE